MTQVPEEVHLVDNEDFDDSVHLHIFPMSKVPPTSPPTPTQKRKVQAKKKRSRVAPSTTNPVVPNDLDEFFAPHGPERSPPVSSSRVTPQVFVFLYFFTNSRTCFPTWVMNFYPRNMWPTRLRLSIW